MCACVRTTSVFFFGIDIEKIESIIVFFLKSIHIIDYSINRYSTEAELERLRLFPVLDNNEVIADLHSELPTYFGRGRRRED